MTLQILINNYKESPEIIGRLLNSINEQIGISEHRIEALVCTDGYEYELDQSAFSGYTFPIQYFVMPHRGICATRNTLLDKSNADYLMFCDCDDMFSKSDGLQKLLTCAEETSADIIGSDYDIESKSEDGFSYKVCHHCTLRLHGKIFKRSYLIDQNIRFPDEMPFSGDMYFLYLAYHLTDKIVWLPDIFYIWKWMPVSVTRGKEHYSVLTYRECTRCYELVLEELKRRELKDLYDDLLMTMILGRYIDWYSKRFMDAPEELRYNAQSVIREFIVKYSNDFYKMSEEKRHQRYIQLLINRRTYGPSTKYIGLDDWINSCKMNS